ncbi:hypothetical protein HAX54_031009 [Datura stramonium]|uniref:Thioredoxin domain-containing protein n=1 Tax=Datura stramonium TaxID=4076 RepID=A0ABS8RL13_DATST|nr:hypothetical protein [Datura stramonium]
MACSLNIGFFVSGPCFNSTAKGSVDHCYSNVNLQLKDLTSTGFLGKPLDASDHRQWSGINSAQQLVDSLLRAGDRLVIIDFYSPGCGGCKTLHPKMCQLAESNPNVIFLKVNYEELKTMCNVLNIPVLPFFRFYRGAQGKVCSFSCTNATIKKFKEAVARYGNDGRRFGPAKGLDESELLALTSIGQMSQESHSLILQRRIEGGERCGQALLRN